MTPHEIWWKTEGSVMRPKPDEDIEEFAKRITHIAWSNGEYVERNDCADMVFRYISQTDNMEARGCLASVTYDIRARGEA